MKTGDDAHWFGTNLPKIPPREFGVTLIEGNHNLKCNFVKIGDIFEVIKEPEVVAPESAAKPLIVKVLLKRIKKGKVWEEEVKKNVDTANLRVFGKQK